MAKKAVEYKKVIQNKVIQYVRGIICLAVGLTIVLCLTPSVAVMAAGVPDIDAAAYVLMAADGGEVLAAENADVRRFPASTTKIMTMVLALEAVERGDASLEDIVSTSEYAASMGGSQVYLYPGEQRTLDEMLVAVAVGSGNDASVAVAEHIGGSIGNFVAMMNQRAAELGMTGTHYANPHGLHDPEHYTTAGDMAKLAHHAISVPHLLEYTGIYEYQFRGEPKPLVLWNTNRLLKWYEGTDGMKTGYTSDAGHNLVATVKRGDMRLISVVMGVVPTHGHFTESMKLLNHGFNNYSYQLIYPAGERICAVPVEKGCAVSVPALVEEAVGLLGSSSGSKDFATSVLVESFPQAPVAAGTQLGELQVLQDGQVVRSVPLLAAADVPRIGLMQAWIDILREVCRFN